MLYGSDLSLRFIKRFLRLQVSFHVLVRGIVSVIIQPDFTHFN